VGCVALLVVVVVNVVEGAAVGFVVVEGSEAAAADSAAAEASSSALETTLEDMVVRTNSEEEGRELFVLTAPPFNLAASFVSETGPAGFSVTTAETGVTADGLEAEPFASFGVFPSTSSIKAR